MSQGFAVTILTLRWKLAIKNQNINEELLKGTVEWNPSVTMRELDLEFNVGHMILHRHLRKME